MQQKHIGQVEGLHNALMSIASRVAYKLPEGAIRAARDYIYSLGGVIDTTVVIAATAAWNGKQPAKSMAMFAEIDTGICEFALLNIEGLQRLAEDPTVVSEARKVFSAGSIQDSILVALSTVVLVRALLIHATYTSPCSREYNELKELDDLWTKMDG